MPTMSNLMAFRPSKPDFKPLYTKHTKILQKFVDIEKIVSLRHKLH